MNLRGKKNTSALQPSKKARKPRKSNTKQIISPKLKTLVDQFTNSNFVIMDEYCKSTSGFVQGTTNFSSNFVCKRHSST